MQSANRTDTEAKSLIRKLYPKAKRVTFVPYARGIHNITAIIDDEFVVRLPRTDHALHFGEYEVAILNLVAERTTLAVPGVITNHLPEYVVVNKVPGEHLTGDELVKLSKGKQTAFAAQIAQFIVELNKALSPKVVSGLREKYKLDDRPADASWSIYLKQHLEQVRVPGKLWLEQLAKRYYHEWSAMYRTSTLPEIVIHDDLHMDNLLFENGRLTSVLDFSELTIGTAAQELRQLFRLNNDIVSATIETYHRLSGVLIPFNEVKVWAVATELAAYCHRITTAGPEHPSAVRAVKNLRKWLPEEFRD